MRGAIRYWLEQAGYDVQLSEYNDFVRTPDDDVIEACLNNVTSSDFFALLIGRNRGSLLKKRPQVTMTRAEFRAAAAASLERPLGICVLVREEVAVAVDQWKRDRGAVVESRYVEDPRFTSSFLREVSGPVKQGKANRWIYRFSDFRDVVDAVRTTLKMVTNFEQALLRRNLLDECLYNLTLLVTRSHDSVQSNHGWGTHVRKEIHIQEDDVGGGTTRLTDKQIQRLGMLFLAPPRETLRNKAMDEALSRGLFLQFDPETRQLESTLEHEALQDLRDDIVRFDDFSHSDNLVKSNAHLLAFARRVNSGHLTGGANVDTDNLTVVLALYDRMDNIFNGLTRMVGWLLDTTESPQIERHASSPVETFAKELEKERATVDHIRWAIENKVFPFGTHLTPELREVARRAEDGHYQQLREAFPADIASDELLREVVKETFDDSVIEAYEPPPPTSRRIIHFP
jgi:Domain of unknown function (DUF4062)